MTPDPAAFSDLVAFARLEVDSGDLEPWAEVIGWLHFTGELPREDVLWLIKLYNAFDSLGSAWAVFRRWPSPDAWAFSPDALDVGVLAMYPCTNERRHLRGGHPSKMVRHLDSYHGHVTGPGSQWAWLCSPIVPEAPGLSFTLLTTWMRNVWGVGRQSAFEWAEFAGKAAGLPVRAGDAQLWESEGPRRSLQRLYGEPRPTRRWLDDAATDLRWRLAEEGVSLEWWDLETVICDFNVMRDGRYYPGRHLAALREEIEGIPPDDRALLEEAWAAVVPEPWASIAPGIDKAQMPVYARTGRIVSEP